MINLTRLNQDFDPARLIGKEITENEYLALQADERIFCTSVKLYDFQAETIIGPPIEPPYSPYGTYSGFVITSKKGDWEEAQRIADSRGWGEKVDGILVEQIPYDEAGSTIVKPIQNN